MMSAEEKEQMRQQRIKIIETIIDKWK